MWGRPYPLTVLRSLVVSALVVLAIVVSVPRGAPAPNARTHLTSAVRPATDPPNAEGIDVADHQHAQGPIHWRVVARQYQFAYVKATEGTSYINRYYRGDVSSALAAGLFVGGYAFATPDAASGAAEAKYFLRHSRYGQNRSLLFPMLDIEWNPYKTTTACYGLSPSALVSWIGSYSDTISRALGVRPIIYTQASFWNKCTGGTSAFSADPLWVGSDQTASAPDLPAGFASWTIWQDVNSSAAGVEGPVDVDGFHGTAAQLKAQLTPPGWRGELPLKAYPAGYRH